MPKQSNQMMSKDQLQRIVRTILMHDVPPITRFAKPRANEVYRQALETLNLNFKGQFEPVEAKSILMLEICNA